MKEYYERDALNYSTLAALDSNYPGQVFKESETKKTTPAMGRGSLVDCLLTSPDEFDDNFIITELPDLSGTIKTIFSYLAHEDIGYSDKEILKAAEHAEYGKNWKDETILKKLKTSETLDYYNKYKTLKNSKKIQISQEEYNKAVTVVEVLKNHEFSSWIFTPQEGVTVKYQVPIYWDERGVSCKALLDILIIDDNNKILYPIDLKVKSDSKYAFKSSFMRYKYYLQAAWYNRGVTQSTLFKVGKYKLENFTFLVTSFDYPEPPLLYRCSDELLHVGRYGGYYQGEKIKGISSLFGDYIWYKEEEKYDYPRELYLNRGFVDLDFLRKEKE